MHRSEVADFDAAAEAYHAALQYEPNNRRTLQRLNSVALRTGSWAGWDALVYNIPTNSAGVVQRHLVGEFKALFRGTGDSPAASLTARLITFLQENDDVSPDLLHSISARLQAMGEFSLGFEVRRVLAQRIRQSPSNQMPHVAPFRRWASASVALGRTPDVEERFRPYPWRSPSAEAREALDAVLVDAEFGLGKVERLVSLAASRSENTLSQSDFRMAELVAGRRIAIVGPGVASGEYGAEIDEFDVVIRTRYSREFVDANRGTSGSRTDLAYYSGTDVHALVADAMPAAEAGALQLVVARPISYAALAGGTAAATAPWLRFYDRDYSLILNGGPLGLTRIIYDVLQYDPAAVSLYNADYYTGAQPFATGYRTGVDSGVAAGSIVMDLFRAHDLLADFVIHRNLFARGILSGPPEVARIARLAPEEYTAALEHAWQGHTRRIEE